MDERSIRQHNGNAWVFFQHGIPTFKIGGVNWMCHPKNIGNLRTLPWIETSIIWYNPFPHLPLINHEKPMALVLDLFILSLRRYYFNLIGWFHPWNLSDSSGVFQRYVCIYDYMYVLVIYNGKSDITARAVSTAHCSPLVSFLKWVWKEGTVAIKLLFNHKLYWVDQSCRDLNVLETHPDL